MTADPHGAARKTPAHKHRFQCRRDADRSSGRSVTRGIRSVWNARYRGRTSAERVAKETDSYRFGPIVEQDRSSEQGQSRLAGRLPM